MEIAGLKHSDHSNINPGSDDYVRRMDKTVSRGMRLRSSHGQSDAIPIRFCTLGYINIGGDGTIINVDNATCFVLGLEREYLIGRSLIDFVVLGEREKYSRHLSQAVAGMQPILTNLRLRPEGVSTPGIPLIVRMDSYSTGQLDYIRMTVSAEVERRLSPDAGSLHEEALRCMVEGSRDGTSLTDENDRVVLWNHAMELITGLRFDEVVGKDIWEVRKTLMPKLDRTGNVRGNLDQFLNTSSGNERRKSQDGSYELLIQQPSGEVRLVQQNDLRIPTARGFVIGSTCRDSTESSKTAGNLRRRNADLALLYRAEQAFTSTLKLDQVLQSVLNEVTQLLDVTQAYIWLMDDAHTDLVCSHAVDRDGNTLPSLAVQYGSRLAEWIREGGEVLSFSDLWVKSPFSDIDCAAEHPTMRSCLFVPLRSKEVVVGALHLVDERPDHFTAADSNLIIALASAAAIAVENAMLYKQAQTLAALEERQRLAWELHDGVNQSLFSAGLIAEILPRLWQLDPEEGRQSLEDLRWLIRGAVAEMREVLTELRPVESDDLALDVRLRQLGNIFSGRTGIPVVLDLTGEAELPVEVQTALYRLCREALSNTAKHAGASQVAIKMKNENGAIELCIRDDGSGFDVVRAQAGHHGLQLMQERAKAIGAGISIASEPQHGTEIFIRWAGNRNE